ncbi:putative lactoylglutathione lyase [Mucilaginibacter yixingensis]|uniref:Putative lactoylglutathione lyase n=1 Tax=Mucilaginibacter yixingensis TaxID=1295612 RepID=A0A2T5JEE6_9SPHI|nr:VOC family protein [Mucilaginibacter yixingensis]PTR00026.1 putative lactoylglutathione lyase [Mucilaginibacter yixingensis]
MILYEQAFAGFAVKDIEAAKQFYTDKLGISIDSGPEGTLSLKFGNNTVLVYPKPDHVPAVFTVLNLPVDNIDTAVDELTAKGVKFEHYDLGSASTDERGIFRAGGPLIAWFKDPSGNIFSVLQKN